MMIRLTVTVEDQGVKVLIEREISEESAAQEDREKDKEIDKGKGRDREVYPEDKEVQQDDKDNEVLGDQSVHEDKER